MVDDLLWDQFGQTAQYAAIGAVIIGAIVRALKSNKLPFTVPSWLRPWLAVALGGVQATLEALTFDLPWPSAILHGLLAALVAIFGHDAVIEGVRKGREIGVSK